jgi:hypothetical protein
MIGAMARVRRHHRHTFEFEMSRAGNLVTGVLLGLDDPVRRVDALLKSDSLATTYLGIVVVGS